MIMNRPIIRLKPNQCPKCFGLLSLIEEECYEAPLNSNAIAEHGDTYVELYLKCKDCGEKYSAIKKGMRYFIAPISQPTFVVKDYNPFYAN